MTEVDEWTSGRVGGWVGESDGGESGEGNSCRHVRWSVVLGLVETQKLKNKQEECHHRASTSFLCLSPSFL